MELRTKFINKFSKFLDIKKAEKLEQLIYDHICEESIINSYVSDINNKNFQLFYKNKCNSLIVNIDPNSYIENNYLLDKLKNKEISYNDLLKLNNYELFPEIWKENIKIQELLDKEIYEGTEQSVTNLFKCRYCIKKGITEPTCTYVSVQTRSADEPATNFVTCVKCNKSWRD